MFVYHTDTTVRVYGREELAAIAWAGDAGGESDQLGQGLPEIGENYLGLIVDFSISVDGFVTTTQHHLVEPNAAEMGSLISSFTSYAAISDPATRPRQTRANVTKQLTSSQSAKYVIRNVAT